MSKLKPCPFCGSEDIHWTTVSTSHVLTCNNCFTQGPIVMPYQDQREAMIVWNERKGTDK